MYFFSHLASSLASRQISALLNAYLMKGVIRTSAGARTEHKGEEIAHTGTIIENTGDCASEH